MKSLYLLSFSLTFLSQGIANDFSYEEHSEQVGYEVADYDDEDELFDEEQAYEPRSSRSQNWLSDAEQQGNSSYSQSSSNQSQDCLSPFHRMHVSARHNESKGIGYHDGYTTLEAFGIYDGWSSHFMPFLDLRGHVFNNGKLAGNVGIGERTLMSSINHTFGSYLYYDVRRVGHGLTVNQLSPGLELVGRRMEYRINGYFPLGKDKTHKYNYKFDEFEGNNIILKSKQQRALRGGDAEVGVHVTQSTKYDLYAAAGPYYLHAPHAHSWGGRTRLLGRYKEYVSLEVAYSYDNLFRSIVQGSVAVTLPFGKKLKRTGQGCPQGNDLLLSRASFAPSRFEIPVVKRVKRTEKAINPATGKPWTVWFVDNTSHSAGTYGSPFPTLLQAQNASAPNDMIYVFPGDGTTTGMDKGITLQDGQSFFGSGIKQRFSTTKGTMTIPKFSDAYPLITNSSGFSVTLANGNTVSGINIIAAQAGISSPNTPINGATITGNLLTLSPSTLFGIALQGVGTINIRNNQIVSPLPGASNGILVQAIGGKIHGSINNNFISAGAIGIEVGAFPSSVNPGSYDVSIKGNTIVIGPSSKGISAVMEGTSKFSIIENSLTNGAGTLAAIFVRDYLTTVSGLVNIANNQIVATPPVGNYVALAVPFSSPNSPNVSVSVINNSVSSVGSAGLGSFNFTSGATDTMCLTLENNAVNGGFAFTTTGTGVINIDSCEGNVGGPVSATGNVNVVPEGTCGN